MKIKASKFMLLTMAVLLLAGCGAQQKEQQINNIIRELNADLPDEGIEYNALKQKEGKTVHTTDDAVTRDKEGKLHFDLTGTTQIQLQSRADHKGVTINNPAQIKDIVESLKNFVPYSPVENYEPEYDYTITFYQEDQGELAQIKAFDNFIISYEGNLYYDIAEKFYIWKVREPYIEAVKETFSIDGTVFHLNGEIFDLKRLESGINSIMEYFWFGEADIPEPQVLLVGHINPNISYAAIFDVEKMDYVFKNYGTNFTYRDYSAASLIYVFQNAVYNYWGSILYRNTDDLSYISNLSYANNFDNLVKITLSSKKEEKSSEITRINYYHMEDPEVEKGPRAKLLSEFLADLTHDDKEDLIKISGAEKDPELTYLDVIDSDGKTRLWTETAHTAHAGWNSVYLYRKDGMDYLLVFNPYQSTGLAYYTFTVFYITGPNRMEMIDSGAYTFSYGAEKGAENYFDEAKFRAFADRLNIYLKDSFLLMSTEGGTLIYSTPENILLPSSQYETEIWLRDIKASLY